MLAQRVKNISPSVTLAIDAKAKQLKREGKDLVIFGAGEPDFNTPENIKQAGIKAIKDNVTRYTPVGGMTELKSSVANKFKKINKIRYDVSEILISCGGKHSLYNAAMAVLDAGDEAVLPVPYWVSYEEMIKLSGAKPIFCKTDDKFKITAENIKDKITGKTKLLILNSPSNPTGAIVDESEIKKIAKLVVDNNFYVISDEVYEFFIYGKNIHKSIASISDDVKKLTITVNSVSKTYAMTGWRIGYCGADRDIIRAMENLQSHSTSNPSNIAQMAAIEALNGHQESVSTMTKAFDERRKFMHKRLNEIEGVKCLEPEGAFYAFPDISETKLKSMEFASKLLEKELVAVVPGIAFGSDKHIRLSYAASMQEIEKGMDRIERFVKGLKH